MYFKPTKIHSSLYILPTIPFFFAYLVYIITYHYHEKDNIIKPGPQQVGLLSQNLTTEADQAEYQLTITADLIIIPNISEETRCLDGSPPSLYYRKGKEKDRWILFMQSGGWCWNIRDCYKRSKTKLGSSKFLPSKLPEKYQKGFLSPDAKVNPDFATWNLVHYNYCDGASFSGDKKDPVEYSGNKIYFKGKNILDAVLNYTLTQLGLEKAERVILGGFSAGGLAVFIHADYIRSKLPSKNIQFHAFSDVGLFPDVQNIREKRDFQEKMRNIYNMQNINTDTLDSDCVLDKKLEETWHCIFAQHVYHYVQTPVFVLHSAYDAWTLKHILDIRCQPSKCKKDQLEFLEKKYYIEFMTIVKESLIQSPNTRNNALYIPTCYVHPLGTKDDSFTDYSVKNKTIRQALGDWYFERETKSFISDNVYIDECGSPNCNPTC